MVIIPFRLIYKLLMIQFRLLALPDLFLQFLQGSSQFPLVYRLQKIMSHTVTDSLLCILEMGVTADYDYFQSGIQLLHPFYQLQATAAWHADICDQNIRLCLPYHFAGFLSVVGDSHHLHSHRIPVDQCLDQLADPHLIICNYYL